MRQSPLDKAAESGAEVGLGQIRTHPSVTSSRPAGRRFGQLPGQLAVSVEESASVAVTTCFIAEAMDGAFCLKLSAVRPLAAVCKAANAVFTCSTLGLSTGEADASAASRLVLTLSIAVFSAATPFCAGFTSVRALSADLSAATSSQAAAVGAAVVVGVPVVAGTAVGGGLVWLGVELVPQLPVTHSRTAAATAADATRPARRSRRLFMVRCNKVCLLRGSPMTGEASISTLAGRLSASDADRRAPVSSKWARP
jgi:hypothetical protein